jgi:uncharacterized protein (TIGR00369 family)
LDTQSEDASEESKKDAEYLPNSTWCFVCGKDNHAGLKTRFFLEDGVVKARFSPQEHHCGYINVVHGGVIVALMDEAMGWAAAHRLGRMCYTAELTIRYLHPVPADHEILVTTEVVRAGRRLAEVRAVAEDDTGKEHVRCEGRFIPFSEEETLKVDDMLLYGQGELRLFEKLRDAQP